VYCKGVPLYPPVGYPGITWWAGVVPEGTQVPDGYPISYPIGYPGSMLPGYGSPSSMLTMANSDVKILAVCFPAIWY